MESIKKRWREKNHFLGHVVSEACLIKKEKKKHFQLEIPAQQKITVEGKAISTLTACSSFHLYIVPNAQTNTQTNNPPVFVSLSFFIHFFTLWLTLTSCLQTSALSHFVHREVWTAKNVVFGWAAMFMCVFCPLLTSTKCCHGDASSTLPVKAALTAAVFRTQRDCCCFLPPKCLWLLIQRKHGEKFFLLHYLNNF